MTALDVGRTRTLRKTTMEMTQRAHTGGGGISHEIAHSKKRAFLAAFQITGNVKRSAQAAEVSRRTHYDWISNDPQYAIAFVDAKEDAIEHLEGVARDRATEGSDVLLIFLLKSLRPDVYRERVKHDHKVSV